MGLEPAALVALAGLAVLRSVARVGVGLAGLRSVALVGLAGLVSAGPAMRVVLVGLEVRRRGLRLEESVRPGESVRLGAWARLGVRVVAWP